MTNIPSGIPTATPNVVGSLVEPPTLWASATPAVVDGLAEQF